MGNLNSKATAATAADHTVRYDLNYSVRKSVQSLPPVLLSFQQLESDRLLPNCVSMQPNPRILSIACGFGEDAPLYRRVFGEHCHVEGIDESPKFAKMAQREERLGRDTHFTQGDARHLPFKPDFNLIMMRHPEPSSDRRLWTEIFVEAALFAQKAKAPIVMTAFTQHELNFFIRLSEMMGERGVSLVKTYVNPSLEPDYDQSGADHAHDRYVAVFQAKP